MESLPYNKIQTLFERDKKTFKVIEGRYSRREFSFIDPWEITEKIDGTNIRLHFCHEYHWEIGGRTDNAQIPTNLLSVLKTIVEEIESGVREIMAEHDLEYFTIYGEGYGAGIQKGGGRYLPCPGFLVFDMRVDQGPFLSQDAVVGNASRLGLPVVPPLGVMRTKDVVELVETLKLKSKFGDFPAEGVVARPMVELKNAANKRVMWKIKSSDF